MTQVRTSRRIVFHGLGALGVAVALAGCGGDVPSTSGGSTPGSGPDSDAAGPSSSATEGSSAPSESAPPAQEPAAGLVATSEVPVGGGVVLPDDNLVVVQPTEGEFKAYSATCTHTGTQVSQVDGAAIGCPAHGSRFSITDGAPLNGPAAAPLPEVGVLVDNDQVVLA